MRVNIYAEEMTERVEVISKEIDGQTFTGLRIYLYMPVSEYKFSQDRPVDINVPAETFKNEVRQVKGPFIHRPGDDDSSAVTFWGKTDLREVLMKAIAELDRHYTQRGIERLAKKLIRDPVPGNFTGFDPDSSKLHVSKG